MQKLNSNKKLKLILSLVFIVITLSAFKVYDDGDDFETAKSFDLFHDVVREVRLYYVDNVDIPKLINEATKEFLQKLDPYTVFYSEDKIEDYKLTTTGTYGGIGASVIERNDYLLVNNIIKGAPADSLGLKIADKIISVNGIKITEKNISEIKQNLKGEAGSLLNIGIKRFGIPEPFQISVKRKKIHSKLIPYSEIINGNIGYIKLSSFMQNASVEFKQKLQELNQEKKLSGLIIDLRENPGGLLDEAVKIVNFFVPKGSDIVFTKGKVKSWNHDYRAEKEPIFPDLPLVVLINNHSASASEIVSGALQDLDRAVIIGQRSFGKGLVQVTREVEYNTRIKITTAKYYIPSGRCIQAIDYSHRNPDGSVGKVPDSLISEFKTKNGRKVYNGGGIEPDVETEKNSLNKFTKQLLNAFLIFDFSTKYCSENKTITDPESFSFSVENYKNFINYVINSGFEFHSETENLVGEVLNTAEKEDYDINITEKIIDLQNSLDIDEKEILIKYSDEIKPLIEKEIVKRYYYEDGVYKYNSNKDEYLKSSIMLLNNKEKYQNILTGSHTKMN